MEATENESPVERSQASLAWRFGLVALLLGLLSITSVGLGELRASFIQADDQASTKAVDEVAREVEQYVDRLLNSIERDGRRVSAHRDVRQQVSLAADSVYRPTAQRILLERLRRERLPERTSVELYDSEGDLLAWSDFSIPRGEGFEALPDSSHTRVVIDGSRRLVVIQIPVRDLDASVVGSVRIARVVEARVPVRNEYLREYRLADSWQRQIRIPFGLSFVTPPGPTIRTASLEDRSSFYIRAPDGMQIGRLQVPEPSAAVLALRVRARWSDVAAFWLTLLFGWGVFGLLHLTRFTTARYLDAPARRTLFAALGAGTVTAVAWWAVRFGLLALVVPARWFGRGLDGPDVFNPAFLATDFAGGVARTAGDLVITSGFSALFGLGALAFVLHISKRSVTRPQASRWGVFLALGVGALVAVGGIEFAGRLIGSSFADATIPYFDRAGPLPPLPVFFVLVAFLLVMLAAMSVAVAGLLWAWRSRTPWTGGWNHFAGSLAVVVGVTVVALPFLNTPAVTVLLGTIAAFLAAVYLSGAQARWGAPLTIRGALVLVLALASLVYPVVATAHVEKREALMVGAAEDFSEGQDARVLFAIEQVLGESSADDTLRKSLIAAASQNFRRGGRSLPTSAVNDTLAEPALPPLVQLDSIAADLVTGSLLASLADYSVSLGIFSPRGDSLAGYRDASVIEDEAVTSGAAPDRFSLARLRREFEAAGGDRLLVRQEAFRERLAAFRYAGLGPVRQGAEARLTGWVVIRVSPRPQRYVSETPFPQVLVPAGLYSDMGNGEVSFAEYRDGILVRSRGVEVGYRLPPTVQEAVAAHGDYWTTETVEDRTYRTYYLLEGAPNAEGGQERIMAVRIPEIEIYDHLFFLLRLTLAGLLLGCVIALISWPLRREYRMRYGRESRFRDRVLNRFLLVGVLAVAVTGLIGQRVIVEQNKSAVDDRLKRHLARVEALMPISGPFTEPEALLDGARPEVLAARAGLDLNLYSGPMLIASSRSQLVRQRLIDRRMPPDVYKRLFLEGERYAFAEERIGSFTYTTGFRAVAGHDGRVMGAIAVPSLPEQAAIEADQARMVAYLFGALLLLLIGIFALTTVMANQLTRPFRRLRAGLDSVGQGHIEAPIAADDAPDEVGELVDSFNKMQGQLAESRQRLAAQERQLAWREMARQVAHEIKNPLTPMKLSVQHLRRAYANKPSDDPKFSALLERISTTLIEQIDTLSRIAGEFSSFARMPRRVLEHVDLNEVVREAAALLHEDASSPENGSIRIELRLASEGLPVCADREEVRRAYINLLKNALQAMRESEDGGRATVTTDVSVVGPDGESDPEKIWAYSTVADTGPGITEEVRERIFEPNFSTKTSGMGLGLALVKRAVEESGGEIDFTTRLGEGTTFHLWWPLNMGPDEQPA
ncbi:ATP-binding protein [soil metagenome]